MKTLITSDVFHPFLFWKGSTNYPLLLEVSFSSLDGRGRIPGVLDLVGSQLRRAGQTLILFQQKHSTLHSPESVTGMYSGPRMSGFNRRAHEQNNQPPVANGLRNPLSVSMSNRLGLVRTFHHGDKNICWIGFGTGVGRTVAAGSQKLTVLRKSNDVSCNLTINEGGITWFQVVCTFAWSNAASNFRLD